MLEQERYELIKRIAKRIQEEANELEFEDIAGISMED